MAGAGEKEESENPFSFKSFMKRGDGAPNTEKVRSSSKSASSTRKKTSSKKGSNPGDNEVVVGARKASDDENPFSFTRFVERKSSKPPHPAALTSSSGDEENSLTIVNPIPSATPLPPQNSIPKTKPKSGKTATSAKPSTSPHSNLNRKTSSSKKTTVSKREPKKELSIFDVSDGSDSESLFPGDPVPIVPVADVFSLRQKSGSSVSSESSPETPCRNLGGLGLGDPRMRENVSGHGSVNLPFDDMAELKKLSVENERLQKELTRSENAVKSEKEKNLALRGQIKELKVKEAEDTKALEDMVQKVESNLVTTTKRAVAAETTIKKLKQEIASLQAQLSHSTPQAMQQHYEELLGGVREKSCFASQQLLNAAQMADKNIRELVSGVEVLKNVSEILQFIDSTAEVRTHEERKT